MQVATTPLQGVLLFLPKVFRDERGFFLETFSQRAFDNAVGRPVTFVQDNHSRSAAGVLRGLHYQAAPHAQGKLVQVVKGRAFDVAVDLRRTSPTFGRWYGVELAADEPRQLWIPEGFAHGFLALEDETHFLYKTTAYYAPDSERAIRWNDPEIGITWPKLENLAAPLLAPKDAAAAPLGAAVAAGDVFDF
jgi:dTDP-4-dehydrorhamnose 3,5-epimerase